MLAAARAWAAGLRARHAEVVRVGCFGSYTREDYVPGSDLDVLIEVAAPVGDTLAIRQADRAARYRPDSFPVGLDVFVYTTAELDALRADGAAFVRTIDADILWLT